MRLVVFMITVYATSESIVDYVVYSNRRIRLNLSKRCNLRYLRSNPVKFSVLMWKLKSAYYENALNRPDGRRLLLRAKFFQV